MVFQQRHYVRIAEVIKTLELSDARRRTIALALAEMFKSDNYKFKPHLFFNACAVQENAIDE